ncbi:conserved domain protein [delta proteobacterium NaphS2]|nr:conserved domain protein [delta proteobacterium NaphS2]
MIDYETFCQIKELKRNNLNAEQIARELSLNSRTVRKWVSEERYMPRKSGWRPSKLDPFKRILSVISKPIPIRPPRYLRVFGKRVLKGAIPLSKSTFEKSVLPKYRPI